MKSTFSLLLLSLAIATPSIAENKTTIRIAVQASGTVGWELSALPNSADFQVQIHPVANAEASKIALQSGAVDIIVSDWLWVSRLRATGSDFSFYPYSSTSGALVVASDSPIHSLKDLQGKKLGIAGGELDKNWLLLQALAQKEHLDLSGVEKTFGAPPLLNEQLKQNRLDALLTYWHFAAPLQAQGYKQLLDGKAILQGLGITENLPNIGYVFKQSWAQEHKAALNNFFKASATAKQQLCSDDNAWQKLLPLIKSDDAATQKLLRDGYCAGSVSAWNDKDGQAAEQIYKLLDATSNHQLTGSEAGLQAGTFWKAE
jgi:NitT/TauT family transport system substrate-binding protein